MVTALYRGIAANPVAAAALGVIILLAVTALAAPFIAPFDPSDFDRESIYAPPSADHWMGTDGGGRDVFSGLIGHLEAAFRRSWCAAIRGTCAHWARRETFRTA